jgi:hypothetical protein
VERGPVEHQGLFPRHILDDRRSAIQHDNHLAFELGWLKRLHADNVNNRRVTTKLLDRDYFGVRV